MMAVIVLGDLPTLVSFAGADRVFLVGMRVLFLPIDDRQHEVVVRALLSPWRSGRSGR
jgi:hypothetical protein